MSLEPRVVWQLDSLLGEGPVWLADQGLLAFVDIKGGAIFRYDPASGKGTRQAVGGMPSFILPASDGGLVVGSRSGLYRLGEEGLDEPFLTLPQPAHNRTNDATVGPDGRLWLGTMDDQEQEPTGALWCLDRGVLRQSPVRAVVTNGPAVSADGRWLYHVDSGERTVWRFALGSDGMPVRGEVFLKLAEDEGYPDGVILDAEDCLWVALWDGWGVRRYAPDGTLLLHVAFPCARVTKVALGGPDLATAYVTTARVGLSQEELERQPLAGSLFAFDAPAPGRPVPAVLLA